MQFRKLTILPYCKYFIERSKVLLNNMFSFFLRVMLYCR